MGQSYFVWTYLIFRFFCSFCFILSSLFFSGYDIIYLLKSKFHASCDFTYAPSLSYPSSPIGFFPNLLSSLCHPTSPTLIVGLCLCLCSDLRVLTLAGQLPWTHIHKWHLTNVFLNTQCPCPLQCSLVLLKLCSSMTRT